MASGIISLGTDNHLTGRIVWSAVANGTVANSSTVTVDIQAARSYGDYTTSGTFTGSVTIAGSTQSFAKFASVGLDWVSLYTYSYTKAHNNDGVGTCYIAGTINGPTETSMDGRTVSASKTVTLDTIARAASLVTAPNFTDEDNPTITYSNPAGSAVEKLEACISLTGSSPNIAYRDVNKKGTSYTFNLTDAERQTLRNATLSGSTSRSVKFFLRTTINGVVYNSIMEKTFTVINAQPQISALVMDTNETTVALTGDRLSTLIKGYSSAAYEISGTALKGASITGYSAKSGGATSESSSGVFNNTESSKFTFAVSDNRGLSAEKTIELLMIDYFKPTVSTELVLELDTDTTVRASIVVKGTFYNGSFGYEKNSLEILIKHSAAADWISLTNDLYFETTTNGNNYFIDFGVSNLDYTKPFTYQVKVIDKLDSALSAEETKSYNPVFDWSAEDFNFNVPITMSGNTVLRHTDANKVVLSAEGADIYLRPNGTNTDDGQLRLFPNGSATLNGSKILTVDLVYPVGAIYISTNSTNPSNIFGGTWEQIKDRFLLAAGSSYAAGATGGEATHKLTVSEMPAHSHNPMLGGTRLGGNNGSSSGWQMAAHSNWSQVGTYATTSSSGGGAAHNNMPPYLAVYIWKRTA